MKSNSESFQIRVSWQSEDIVGFKIDLEEKHEPNDARSEPSELFSDQFSKLSRSWTSTAIGFFEFAPLISEAGFMLADHNFQEHTLKLVADCADEETATEDSQGIVERVYTIHRRETSRVLKAVGQLSQITHTANVLRRSTLASLISEYESFMFQLGKLAVEIAPESLLNDSTKISFSELKDFQSIDEFKKAFLVSQLEEHFHMKSHVDIIDWFSTAFKVNLRSDTRLFGEFIEACQRRHLISHSGAVASKRYVEICKKHECPSQVTLALGEQAQVDRKYLRRATARVYQMGFFTLHMVWQKLLKQTGPSDQAVLVASHDFLERDLTKMARRVTRFALEREKDKPKTRMQAYLTINEAQSYLFDPDMNDAEKDEAINKSLSRRDWDERSPVVDLALACLKRDYAGIAEKVVAASTIGEVPLTYANVFTWNIFREARENADFIDGVVKAFGRTAGVSRSEKAASPSL